MNYKITIGHRSFFFDIKKSKKGDLYLSISERKRTDDAWEHHRVLIFEEDLKSFVDTLRNSLAEFKEIQYAQKEDRKYSVEKIRETHAQAYQPWTKEDDEKLELLFCERKTVEELAYIFSRKEGAIISRIKKLELIEKYGQ